MEDKKKELTPGWVVWCSTIATWEVVEYKSPKKEPVIETKVRHGSQILYAGQDVAKANEAFEFYTTRNVFPEVFMKEVDDLPDWGTGRFVK